ncbi:heat stress transcription factor A-7a-like [Rutidosis leptorrhynchoides]|uniref:heat stress transcription factor A-7a-like n=1 Tax=Rutidosis leptorrhynchoides TaxID=125765 RepID=UPI003A99CA2B
MNPFISVVKEEYPSSIGGGGGGASTAAAVVQPPKPREDLHDGGPPPFLTKVYDMVDDENIDHILSWSKQGRSFVVWDPQAFSANLLPRYFKHNNFSSFIRQLNTYGFRKIDADIWEFANDAFLKGHRHILKNIKRRKPPPHPPSKQQVNNPCVEVGQFGIDGEIERLQRDKEVLMMELVKLRQQQQTTRAHLQEMELRLQGTEKKQQKTMRFLAKAIQSPEFLQKLARHSEKMELESMIKKRRRPAIEQAEYSENGENFRDFSELEELALEMQGFGKSKRNQNEERKEFDEFDGRNKVLDDFLEELFDGQYDMGGSKGQK